MSPTDARSAESPADASLPHAVERVSAWAEAWRNAGRLVLLLDFDGTLAPIVERPDLAAIPDSTRRALERILAAPGVTAAVVSGRGMHDARERAAIPDIAYAGNHGMEIDGAGLHRIHQEAAAARPALEAVCARLQQELASVPGALVEDKGLTLSIHYRQVDSAAVDGLRQRVRAAAGERDELRVTEGKAVLEIRPRVDWDKGRAVEFLLDELRVPAGAPVLYLGDDTTDEDAFRALQRRGQGEGVVVADPPPPGTAASSYLREPAEVGELFDALVERAPA